MSKETLNEGNKPTTIPEKKKIVTKTKKVKSSPKKKLKNQNKLDEKEV